MMIVYKVDSGSNETLNYNKILKHSLVNGNWFNISLIVYTSEQLTLGRKMQSER